MLVIFPWHSEPRRTRVSTKAHVLGFVLKKNRHYSAAVKFKLSVLTFPHKCDSHKIELPLHVSSETKKTPHVLQEKIGSGGKVALCEFGHRC